MAGSKTKKQPKEEQSERGIEKDSPTPTRSQPPVESSRPTKASSQSKVNDSPTQSNKCRIISIVVAIALGLGIYALMPYKLRSNSIERILFCPYRDAPGFHFNYLDGWLFEGMHAKVPLNISQEELETRNKRIAKYRGLYRYTSDADYPEWPPWISCFSRVKCEEGYTVWDTFHFEGDVERNVISLISSSIPINILKLWKDFESFHLIFKDVYFNEPLISKTWKLDSTFGKQRLSGVDPMLLTRIDKIPPLFQVDTLKVEELLGEGKTFAEELAEGHFFIEDLAVLKNIYTRPGMVIGAPFTLFHLSGSVLLPMAIQMTQDPTTSPCGVFYPTDPPTAWLFAKTAVQTAVAAHHQVGAHLLLTHLVGEVWSVATRRTLDEMHPVHRLLHIHFRFTLEINERARDFLIPEVISQVTSTGVPGAFELGGRLYAQWNFTEHYLPTDLLNRRLWEPSLPAEQQSLPGFDYRDFALPLWHSIHKYVENVLGEFYFHDNDVAKDLELQAWAKEISSPTGGRMKGFPSSFRSKKELEDALTMIIFTCSVQHAAVNFGQFQYLGWVPNMPLGLYIGEWPTTKEEITEEYFFKALPGYLESASQAGAVRVLSRLPDPWNTLINVHQWNDPRVQRHADNYREDLLRISKEVKEKNEHREPLDKYPFLDPAQIPLSVAI